MAEQSSHPDSCKSGVSVVQTLHGHVVTLVVGNVCARTGLKVVVQLVAFFFPLMLISLLQAFLPDHVAYTTMLVIGLAFIFTHQLWMRNIDNRMMRRKYILLEGFRSSR